MHPSSTNNSAASQPYIKHCMTACALLGAIIGGCAAIPSKNIGLIIGMAVLGFVVGGFLGWAGASLYYCCCYTANSHSPTTT